MAKTFIPPPPPSKNDWICLKRHCSACRNWIWNGKYSAHSHFRLVTKTAQCSSISIWKRFWHFVSPQPPPCSRLIVSLPVGHLGCGFDHRRWHWSWQQLVAMSIFCLIDICPTKLQLMALLAFCHIEHIKIESIIRKNGENQISDRNHFWI